MPIWQAAPTIRLRQARTVGIVSAASRPAAASGQFTTASSRSVPGRITAPATAAGFWRGAISAFRRSWILTRASIGSARRRAQSVKVLYSPAHAPGTRLHGGRAAPARERDHANGPGAGARNPRRDPQGDPRPEDLHPDGAAPHARRRDRAGDKRSRAGAGDGPESEEAQMSERPERPSERAMREADEEER